MTKKRHVLSQNWSKLRAKIAQTIFQKGLLELEFRPLSIHEDWNQIKENIYSAFCSERLNSIWLWNYFKLDTYSISNLEIIDSRPDFYLHHLIDTNETVWFMIPESVNEATKFWLYEGKILSIQAIINEICYDALYIISKKYDWLICIDHYDNLIATGNYMPDKLRRLKQLKNNEHNI